MFWWYSVSRSVSIYKVSLGAVGVGVGLGFFCSSSELFLFFLVVILDVRLDFGNWKRNIECENFLCLNSCKISSSRVVKSISCGH